MLIFLRWTRSSSHIIKSGVWNPFLNSNSIKITIYLILKLLLPLFYWLISHPIIIVCIASHIIILWQWRSKIIPWIVVQVWIWLYLHRLIKCKWIVASYQAQRHFIWIDRVTLVVVMMIRLISLKWAVMFDIAGGRWKSRTRIMRKAR